MERAWNSWPWQPPRPRKGGPTYREHALAEPAVYVPENLCRYGPRRPARCRPGAPVCVGLLCLYAIPMGVLLALYAPDLDMPPTVSEPMPARERADVDPDIPIPADVRPEPEPPLDLDGTAFEGEGGSRAR